MSTPLPSWLEWFRAGLFPFLSGVLATLFSATAVIANRRWALRDKADALKMKADEDAEEKNEAQQKLEHAGQEEWERGVLAEGAALRREMREDLAQAKAQIAALQEQMLRVSHENLDLRRQMLDYERKTEILQSENVSLRLEVQALKGHLSEIMGEHHHPQEERSQKL